jgi:DNA-binding transcriptional regulator YhcF (GntR family)
MYREVSYSRGGKAKCTSTLAVVDDGVLVPPYRLIADDIRARIARGELGPGDRVPSARAITREWGVAIATATKALAALRDDGVTVARPGVGTIVAERRVRRAERELTRQSVVRAAIAIADADGMAELSIRRVARDLGVATMSLYRHVPGKEDLILAMIDTALGEYALPERLPDGWRRRAELIAFLEWTVFRRHPWLGPSMSLTRPQLSPNGLRMTEFMLGAFDGTGLTLNERMYVQIMLFTFVRGVASALEPEAEAIRETGMTNDEWMATQERTMESLIDVHGMTRFRELIGQEDFDLDLDALFRFGLTRLLDGVEQLVVSRAAGK